HVGDGNFHVTFLLDPDDRDEIARADAVSDRMVRRALAMGGTCTGEHGIGYGKIDYLEAEHPEGVVLMRRIKRALDPESILNPGKIIRLN
ncbi:MAG TPA: FAD-linked oxidase C-terminal domain-containing protein, partial [Amaricoccus sp.]|nr:FAD-linked oxidase C-terminal domain-containing protein [Amaricoccus sp.]